MRCRNCQLLGHTKNRCKNNTTCDNCNLPPHNPLPCSRTMCANCLGEHPSSNLSCPKYKQLKEILKIKTQSKCSMGEAKKKYIVNCTPTKKILHIQILQKITIMKITKKKYQKKIPITVLK